MSSESPILFNPGDDPEMQKAYKKARQSFGYFCREMHWENRRIVPGIEMAVVKGAFSDPPKSRDPDALEVEHMWMVDVAFDGRSISGTLINSPHTLHSVSEGDQVKISGKQISDWMYVSLGEVCGGFTIDLMRSRMDKGERRQHDQAWGFDFGDVGIVNIVPPSYIGDKPKKTGFFSKIFSGPQTPQDYRKVASMEHPMSANLRESLSDALKKNPQFVSEQDELGFTFLHHLALAGSLDGVDVCLQHGANPKLPAANGMTPMALANCFGWRRVIERLKKAGG